MLDANSANLPITTGISAGQACIFACWGRKYALLLREPTPIDIPGGAAHLAGGFAAQK